MAARTSSRQGPRRRTAKHRAGRTRRPGARGAARAVLPALEPERLVLMQGTLPRLWPVPTSAEIDAIVRMTDPVLRNLHITQTYHVLTIALTDLLGEENVAWCAHATWASKTAGFFIRKEVVPGLLRDLLERAGRIC